jgi:hypothetical protein
MNVVAPDSYLSNRYLDFLADLPARKRATSPAAFRGTVQDLSGVFLPRSNRAHSGGFSPPRIRETACALQALIQSLLPLLLANLLLRLSTPVAALSCALLSTPLLLNHSTADIRHQHWLWRVKGNGVGRVVIGLCGWRTSMTVHCLLAVSSASTCSGQLNLPLCRREFNV